MAPPTKKSQTLRTVLTVIGGIALLVVLRFKPWQRAGEADLHAGPTPPNGLRQTLQVAYLPVTCHLTCPVTDFASKTSITGTRFDALRFSEFPPIVEALKGKKLLAGFLTVPLAMKLREQGVPIKICCLGHRDGSEITIAKENPATSLRDLKGQRIAIPSPLSNENFLIHKLMEQQGMQPTDIDFQVIPPPDMPTSLRSKSIAGFVVAEPFCSKAELDGTGRALYLAKDIWPHYISCALVVHEDLIKQNPEMVRDLVRGITESGEWAETHRGDAAKLVAPYFRQKESLVNYVLTQPPTRVSYRMLNPTDAELQKIMDMGMAMGMLKQRTPMTDLLDRTFIPSDIKAARVDMSKMDSPGSPVPKNK